MDQIDIDSIRHNPIRHDWVPFTALYSAILSVTLHLMDEASLGAIDFDKELREVTARLCGELLEMCLMKGDWAKHHCLEYLQAFM